MKRLFLLLATCLILASCKTVLPPADIPNVHVYNSAWQTVAEVTIKAARDVTPGDALTLDEYVAQYNSAHTDDQLFIVEGAPVPIEAAPEATAFIVNTYSLDIYWQGAVARTDLIQNRDAWRLSAEGMADPDTGILVPCTLYVDNIPPTPPAPPLPLLYVSLIDWTAHQLYFVESYATQADAMTRYTYALKPQAEVNNSGSGDGPGDLWQAYIGAVPFAWPGA